MRLNGLSLSLLLGLALTTACGDDAPNNNTADMGVAADTGTTNPDSGNDFDGAVDGAVESDAATSTLTKAAFIEAFPAAFATASLACCPAENQPYDRADLESMAEEAIGFFLADDLAIWEREIAIFNSAKADEILAGLRLAAEDCETLRSGGAAYTLVESTITGTLPENANCITPFEDDDFSVYSACAPGFTCINHEPLEGDETYICEPIRTVGQPCESDDAYFTCATGSYCEPDARVCDAALPNGEECISDEMCMSGACVWDETAEINRCGDLTPEHLYCLGL